MDTVKQKIRHSSMAIFVGLLGICSLLGISQLYNLGAWLTDYVFTGSLANGLALDKAVKSLGQLVLLVFLLYISFIFRRIGEEETPFFPALPRKLKVAAILLFFAMTLPRWIGDAVHCFTTQTLVFTLVDESTIFALLLAAILFCFGRMLEYGYLIQNDNDAIV